MLKIFFKILVFFSINTYCDNLEYSTEVVGDYSISNYKFKLNR